MRALRSITLLPLVAALLATFLPGPRAFAQGCGSPGAGDCLVAHPSPGCSTASCCTTVCQFAPYCCQIGWDQGCADLANNECLGLCGASGNGDCRSVHSTPGCDDRDCCAAVCALDPGCCIYEWDLTCVLQVSNLCAPPPPLPCGDPAAGSCTVAHSTPSCSNATCCQTVCAIDPSCCVQVWDAICVQFANAYCSACTLTCPAGTVQETEACGQRTNDPCAGAAQVPQPLPAGGACGQVNGTITGTTWSGDRDVWSITVPDGNGDNIAKVTLGFAAEFTGYAALVPAGCGNPISSSPLRVAAAGCSEQTASLCVAPGNYWVIVVPGTFPNEGLATSLACSVGTHYAVRVAVSQDGCSPPCSPTSGPCFETHATPGCQDASCCSATCTVDPFCCSESWDGSCAARAAVLCGAPIPVNDNCSGATAIAIGETLSFNTAVARISQPPIPASCEQGTGTNIGNDVWFVHDATRSGNVVASTCGSPTNLRLAVYTGSCEALTLVGCNSSSVLCTPTTGARLQFVAACNTRYWIRVGGENPDQAGLGSISLSGQGPVCVLPCPADLNNDRIVNGADLGVLLGNWGNAGAGDLDGNGIVNGADLGALLGAFGPCP